MNNTDSRLQSIIFGSVYIHLSCLFLVTYVLHTKAQFKVSSSNGTIFHITTANSIFDMVQLTCHIFCGLRLAFDFEAPYLVEKCFGAAIEAAWMQIALNMGILIICKAVLITTSYDFADDHSKKLKFVSAVWFLIQFSIMISPYSAYLFIPDMYTWDFNFELPLSTAVNVVDFSTTLIYLLIMIVCYSIIIFQMKRKLKTSNRIEGRLTIQAVIYCTYTCGCFFTWYGIEPFLENESTNMRFATNGIWVVWNGLVPVLDIIFNRKIRRQMLSCIPFVAVEESVFATRTEMFSRTARPQALSLHRSSVAVSLPTHSRVSTTGLAVPANTRNRSKSLGVMRIA